MRGLAMSVTGVRMTFFKPLNTRMAVDAFCCNSSVFDFKTQPKPYSHIKGYILVYLQPYQPL